MKNGNEYCHSIHQQIVDLIEKSHLGINERVILDKLSFGKMDSLFIRLLLILNRNFITGFT